MRNDKGIAEKHREREIELEAHYLPVLMEGNVSKLFKSKCFNINHIAGMWRSFQIDLSRAILCDADVITQNFIEYWDRRHCEAPPKRKKDAPADASPPFNVRDYLGDAEFTNDVNAYVSFKIMDAKVQKMRFVDVRILAQAIAWKSSRINDACIYQCLGKAIKENADKFTPENTSGFTEAVVTTLKAAWLEVALPEFTNLKELLLTAMESVAPALLDESQT